MVILVNDSDFHMITLPAGLLVAEADRDDFRI